MKTNNAENGSRKAVGQTKSTTAVKATKSAGRGRKKKIVDDFEDLNMGWEADVQQEPVNDYGSRRNRYNQDEDADSYEGTGFGRSRFGYDGDEDLNDPYETFRRG